MNNDPSASLRSSWLDSARRYRYAVLLATILLLFVATAVAQLLGRGRHPWLARGMVTGVFVGLLLYAVFSITQTRRSVIVGLSFGIPGSVLFVATVFVEQTWLVLLGELFGIAFLGYIAALLLAAIFVSQRVDFDLVCASLCVYLLLGLLWANVYCLVEILQPGSFNLADDWAMKFGGSETIYAVYFSYVTLTTLGYGDITPLSGAARTLAIVEATTGQIYLAVLVARLVGLHVAHSTMTKDS